MCDPSPFTQQGTQQGSHRNSLHESTQEPAGEVTEQIPPVRPASLDSLNKTSG